MDLVGMAVDLITTFWQWAVFGVLVMIGFISNLFDGQGEHRVGFSYEKMPHMQPLPIETKDKGFFKAILHWILGVRQWEIAEDFKFELMGEKYVVPKGFQFDGASVPKFLAMWLSPVGVLLMGGLVHDYAYKYAALMSDTAGRPHTNHMNQKAADQIFRDICIEVNGFKLMNYLAYWSLRAAGFMAWNKHKKNGTHV